MAHPSNKFDGLRIVFNGPPGPEAGRFVEVENAQGQSVNAGEWRQREDGLWELVLTTELNSPLFMLRVQAEALHKIAHALGLPAGSHVTTDTLQAVERLRAQLADRDALLREVRGSRNYHIGYDMNARLSPAPTPEPASPWISVAERMPKPNTVVLASSKRSPHFFAIHKNRAMDPWEYLDGDTCRETVTHWMPLPAAPEQPAKEVQ